MKRIGMSRGEAADMIERFVDGICRQRDWDDFCSWPIIDPHLDSIRLRCAGLPQEFPSVAPGPYCSQAGLDVLRQIVRDLREPRYPAANEP